MSPLFAFISATAAALALSAAPAPAQSQDWPEARPIRIIVAYPFGGVSHLIASALAESLSDDLKTPVVIENLPGAEGNTSMEAIAQAEPDGFTLGYASISPLTRNPHLSPATYDPHKDIVPVVSVMYAPILLVATPSATATDFGDLVDQARARPGAITWATLNNGSVGQMMILQIMNKAHVTITHVPYDLIGLLMPDALAGRFTVMSARLSPMLSTQLNKGTLRILAVGAPERLANYPDVPTFAELGYPDANQTSHFGLFAPVGTPEAVVTRVNAAVNAALQSPAIAQLVTHTGNVATGGTSEAFAETIVREDSSNKRAIKAASSTVG